MYFLFVTIMIVIRINIGRSVIQSLMQK